MGKLSLDFKPTFIPKTITQFFMTRIGTESDKISKLEDLVTRLEAEVRKIDAFKRELPLCMILMNDAISGLKEELMEFKKSESQPVLEEFIPLKKTCDEDKKVESDNSDKRNWLSSVQLWNTNENHVPEQHSVDQAIQKEWRNGMIDEDSGLSLITPGFKNPVRGDDFVKKIGGDNNLVAYCVPDVKSDIQIGPPQVQPQSQQLQTSRKQRRCWSTDLHRRFVGALQQLGGSKAATPKQIRELMRVDGLTNDEVKSHLQKYRLHTKRLSSNSSNVVSRDFWAQPLDHYAEKHMNSQSGSPDGPLLHCTAGGTSTTGGDIMDDGEDEKSEINCCKSHPYTSGQDNV